jgi:hypothetical protein
VYAAGAWVGTGAAVGRAATGVCGIGTGAGAGAAVVVAGGGAAATFVAAAACVAAAVAGGGGGMEAALSSTVAVIVGTGSAALSLLPEDETPQTMSPTTSAPAPPRAA